MYDKRQAYKRKEQTYDKTKSTVLSSHSEKIKPLKPWVLRWGLRILFRVVMVFYAHKALKTKILIERSTSNTKTFAKKQKKQKQES